VKEEPAGQITPVVDAATAGADTYFRYAAKREFDERQPALMLVPRSGSQVEPVADYCFDAIVRSEPAST
jgi:hypothetical protein